MSLDTALLLPTATLKSTNEDDLLLRAERAEEALRLSRVGETNRALVLETAHQVALDILGLKTGIEALRHIAEAARTLSGARYAALGVAHPDGRSLQEFITVGMTNSEELAIGSRPHGAGVLGLLLRRTNPLRIDCLTDHPASVGFPKHHPAMKSFLGVPIRRGETALGSLYLTDKEGADAFTEADETAVQALGAHAAVAIYNLRMLGRQRALVRGLMDTQEEERRAVAYDLHDGLTQFVMAAHAHLESFRRVRDSGEGEKAERELGKGMGYLKEAVVESRRLVNGFQTLALDDLGLAGALERLVADERVRVGWDAALFHNVGGRRFDKTLETAVYRVAQEALTNVRKHAVAQQVRLTLSVSRNDGGAELLTLEIRDWGKGFVPDQHESGSAARIGLQSMMERVRLMEGDFDLESAPGNGTVIRAVFPVPKPAPPQGASGDQRQDNL